MGERVIYDAGLPRNATVSTIIHEGSWRWPLANSTELLILKEETTNLSFLPTDGSDTIKWLLSSSGRFSTSSAWDQVRESKPQVFWKHIVWYPGNLPKASFILWLAVRRKLGTQDRLPLLLQGTLCLLCNTQLETHDHLFFECQYSRQLWTFMSFKGGFSTPNSQWGNLVIWLSSNWKGKSLLVKSWKLCLAISIYHLWKERNRRFHSQRSLTVQEKVEVITEEVRLKASLKNIQDLPQNRVIQIAWRLPDSIFARC